MTRLRLLIVSVFLGCGGLVTSPPPDRAPEEAGASGVDSMAPEGSARATGTLTCPYGVPSVQAPPPPPGSAVVTYDKSCNSDVDCAIGIHELSSCDNEIALGINVDERVRFEQGVCAGVLPSRCPACPCCGGGLMTEDGFAFGGCSQLQGDAGVSCQEGVCRTHFVPSDGG